MKAGGGAALGAIIGAIAGGGKGAAIGAAAGAGAGTGVNAVTRGEQAQIESESRLEFRLQSPITVSVTTMPGEHGSRTNRTPIRRFSSDRVLKTLVRQRVSRGLAADSENKGIEFWRLIASSSGTRTRIASSTRTISFEYLSFPAFFMASKRGVKRFHIHMQVRLRIVRNIEADPHIGLSIAIHIHHVCHMRRQRAHGRPNPFAQRVFALCSMCGVTVADARRWCTRLAGWCAPSARRNKFRRHGGPERATPFAIASIQQKWSQQRCNQGQYRSSIAEFRTQFHSSPYAKTSDDSGQALAQ